MSFPCTKRFTLDKYHNFIKLEFFDEDDYIKLIYGEIREMAIPQIFTVQEYHRLAGLGFLTEDDRVELINGEIIQISPQGTHHITCYTNLLEELAVLVAGTKVRSQDPISLHPKVN